jgi:hypothetical protein
MRNRSVLVLLVVLVATLLPAPAAAWGTHAHRYIMRRAIELLPPPIQPFFARHREELVLRVNDPDLWRLVGWAEDPHHFLDFGVKEYGVYPFTDLPRDYDAALEKFGRPTLERNGLLPWRAAEMFGHLRRTFQDFRGNSPYTVGNAILFASVASHYVQDAFQPLHATDNFDGQQTGQRGVHQRFERDLFERFEAQLTITPAAPAPVVNVRDAMFDVLLASYQLVDPLLNAEKTASAGRNTYDAGYYSRFFAGVRPILERRISEAITGTAALIIAAWEQGGKPTPRLQDVRPAEGVTPAR